MGRQANDPTRPDGQVPSLYERQALRLGEAALGRQVPDD